MADDYGRPHPALPIGATATSGGELVLGGCRVGDLAATFRTPLYVYDLPTIRAAMRQATAAMGDAGSVHYAAKAYLSRWLLAQLSDAGVELDVASAGELGIALAAGFRAGNMRLHGNNKRATDLEFALEAGIGAVVVDSSSELSLLIASAERLGIVAPVLLRLNPGIEAHTHRHLQTGVTDSKFGISLAGGEATKAVATALGRPRAIRLLGYHAHIGTQILELEPYRLLMRSLVAFARSMREAHGYWPETISPGGGLGITYTDEEAPGLQSWICALREELAGVEDAPTPRLSIEPGRALVGQAGVALYRVGSVKAVSGGRTYVAVDGGMADNIRPALYDARYAALPAMRMAEPPSTTVTIAGPYCEAGDILVRDAFLPPVKPGDLIALPAAGAYCLQMSSNYNGALRPAVVTVEAGVPRLVQRRQTIADLLSIDVEDG